MFRSGCCQRVWLRVPPAWGLCALLAVAPGCQLFGWGKSLLSPDAPQSAERTARSILNEIPVSRDAVELEVVFVERPVGDPLLGAALWDEIDELTVPLEVRRSLREHGLLAGVCGAPPPRGLQLLLDQSFDVPEDSKRISAHRFVLPSGGETEIPTSFYSAELTARMPLPHGRTEFRSYENGRGVMRLKVHRLQDGFARLEFLPELHHGPIVNRYAATPVEWRYSSGQKVERLYDQRFSVDLYLGEFAVISSDGTNPDSMGHHFFVVRGDDSDERKIHRVLIVRLAGMARSDPQRAE